MHINDIAALTVIATLLSAAANAQTPPPQNPPTFEDTIQVTATRFGEAVAEVPGSISVIAAEQGQRGAQIGRAAGDAGPAGSVPGLLGVREVDDLLLLIDGIPAGGAFIPQIEAISLNNVERIE